MERRKVTRTILAVQAILAMVPLAARAQSAVYTGTLTCQATADGVVPAGSDPISISSRSYKGTYTHLMTSAGPALAKLRDFGRGDLTGNTLTLRGGGSAGGVTLVTTIQATNTGRTYVLKATQAFSGQGFAAPQTRACKGTARLWIG